MSQNDRQRRGRSNGSQRPRKKRYGGAKKAHLMEREEASTRVMHNRANDRFARSPTPMGFPEERLEPSVFALDWEVQPVPLDCEERVAQEVIRRGEFGWVDDDRVDEIGRFVHDRPMTVDQALSLRSALLQQKTVYSHGRLKSKAKELAKHYRNGTSIVELSKKYDFPPMNVFRVVLEANGWSKNKIKDSFRDPASMKQREQEEFEAAEATDRVSNVDQSETQLRADLFEDILADWFEEQGVTLRRQPEMVKEQQKEHGRPIRTPDLLFLDDVTINGEPVAWIDAKHFYGADVEFQRKKMKKQMQRYIDEWGSGAIVFRHGFSDNLYLPGVLMLDASPLDLTRLSGQEPTE